MPKQHTRPRSPARWPENAIEQRKVPEEELEKAIRQAYGCMAVVAELVGISLRAVYYRLEQSEHLRSVVDEARTKYIDTAQLKLLEKINQGDIAAIIFTLKTLGRDRGFDERPAAMLQVNQINVSLQQAVDSLLQDDTLGDQLRDAAAAAANPLPALPGAE